MQVQDSETPRFSQEVEKDEAKALKNTIAVKANEGDFVEDYSASTKMDRISAKSLNRYMTFPNILRNRWAPLAAGCHAKPMKQLQYLSLLPCLMDPLQTNTGSLGGAGGGVHSGL